MAKSYRVPKEAAPHRWSIRKASGRKDAFYLARLWHHYIGVEYESDWLPYGPYQIAGWENEDEDVSEVFGVIAVHKANNEKTVNIGGGLVELLNADRMVEDLPDGLFDAGDLVCDTNAMLWFGFVDPSWRGRGIGRRLFRERVDWAKAHGAERVFGVGWEREEGRSSRPLFTENNFVAVQRFTDYFSENRDTCPDCGAWPNNNKMCQCEMTLWALDLLQNQNTGASRND